MQDGSYYSSMMVLAGHSVPLQALSLLSFDAYQNIWVTSCRTGIGGIRNLGQFASSEEPPRSVFRSRAAHPPAAFLRRRGEPSFAARLSEKVELRTFGRRIPFGLSGPGSQDVKTGGRMFGRNGCRVCFKGYGSSRVKPNSSKGNWL